MFHFNQSPICRWRKRRPGRMNALRLSKLTIFKALSPRTCIARRHHSKWPGDVPVVFILFRYSGAGADALLCPGRESNISFNSNWPILGSLAEVMVPNPAPLTLFSGSPKLVLFRTLKNSAWNCSLYRSLPRLMFFSSPTYHVADEGPVRLPFLTLPALPTGGSEKADWFSQALHELVPHPELPYGLADPSSRARSEPMPV